MKLLLNIRYRKKVLLYNDRVEELNKVTQERDDIKKQYDEWRKRRSANSSFFCIHIISPFVTIILADCYFRLDEFMAGFNAISLKLKEMYQV